MTFNGSASTGRPWEVDGERYAHGTRARYVAAKCRCEPCRTANSAYAKARDAAVRRGDVRRLVSVDQVLPHLRALRAAGVGRRKISALAGTSTATLNRIWAGRKTRVRADVARRILTVGLDAGNHVHSGATKELIRQLVRFGWAKAEIARELGYPTCGLWFLTRNTVTRDTAARVRGLYEREVALRKHDNAFCTSCGHAHVPEVRQRLIARAVRDGVPPDEIRETWPCFYGVISTNTNTNEARLLMRDITAVRDRFGLRRPSGGGEGGGVFSLDVRRAASGWTPPPVLDRRDARMANIALRAPTAPLAHRHRSPLRTRRRRGAT